MMEVTAVDQNVIINTGYSIITLSKAQGKQLAAQLRKVCATATKYGNKKVMGYGVEVKKCQSKL